MERNKISYQELNAARQHAEAIISFCDDVIEKKPRIQNINEFKKLRDETFHHFITINTMFLEQVDKIRFQCDANFPIL